MTNKSPFDMLKSQLDLESQVSHIPPGSLSHKIANLVADEINRMKEQGGSNVFDAIELNREIALAVAIIFQSATCEQEDDLTIQVGSDLLESIAKSLSGVMSYRELKKRKP